MILTTSEHSARAEGLRLLRMGQFHAAHEVFEHAFRGAAGPSRTLLRALAQLAASYHQLTLGRGRASVRTWQRARLKLASIGELPPAFELAVTALHARLGLSEDGPRFVALDRLGSLQSFPVPEDQTPSA